MPRLRKRKFIQGPENERYVRARDQGYLYPGTNYLGPGNKMDGAPAQSFADEAAYQHDTDYQDFEEATGRNPKLEYILPADDEFLARLEDDDTLPAQLAKITFKTKRALSQVGIIPRSHYKKRKRTGSSLFNMPTRNRMRGPNPFDPQSVRYHTEPPRTRNVPLDNVENMEFIAPPGIVEEEEQSPNPGYGNNLFTRAGAPTAGTGNKAEQVTPVDPTRSTCTHPFHNTVNCSLPWKRIFFNEEITSPTTGAATNVKSITFRLNTPLDIIAEYTYVADPAPANDTLAGGYSNPMYWNYWKSFYRYYTVTKSNYKITIRPNGNQGVKYSAWTYHHGMQGPYVVDAAGLRRTDMNRGFDKHARCTPLQERIAFDTRSADAVAVTITGEYHPGRKSVQNDVVEDTLAQTWHPIGSIPPLKEMMTLIIQPADDQQPWTQQTGNNRNLFDIIVEFTYEVQFKDLYQSIEGPGFIQTLPAVASWYAQAT